MLSSSAVKDFYDRFGSRQDRQAFYEDLPLDVLVSNADFAEAHSAAEFGCGTGRLAARLLSTFPDLSYQGFDVSTTMVELAKTRLAVFEQRASVIRLSPGTLHFPIGDRSMDRLLSTYVLDLLPGPDIMTFFVEARRVLKPGGLLCISSLTNGPTVVSTLVSHLWSIVFRISPLIVGGCRPIELGQFCLASDWSQKHHSKQVQWGIPSEVLVLRSQAA